MGQGGGAYINTQLLDQVTVVDVDGNDMAIPGSKGTITNKFVSGKNTALISELNI